MPRGDRTGPRGSGPMTGRGMGYCAGYPGLDYMYPGPGFGYGGGRGLGRGRGWRRFDFAPFWGYPLPQVAPYSPIPGFQSLDDPWGAAIKRRL